MKRRGVANKFKRISGVGAPEMKAAWGCRTPRRCRAVSQAAISARSWNAAALCRFSLVWLFLATCSTRADILTDSRLAEIKFDQKLNDKVSLDLHFRDENGKDVRLADYFSNKPVILVLGYYGCPMLCTLVLNGMVEGLQDIRWSIGEEYNVVNVSIDPHETPSLAAAKKRSYLKRYGRPSAEAGWHFLTGKPKAIQRLADEVGFRYAYDNVSKQYAHPSGIVVLTPDGKISGYLFGVTYSPNELFTSLNTASSRKIGSRIQDLILLCFHYRPITGRYGNLIMTTVRVLGVATLLGLAALIIRTVRKDKFQAAAIPTPGSQGREQSLLASAATVDSIGKTGDIS